MKYIQIDKGFWAEEKDLSCKTLSEAKKVNGYAHIYRQWIGITADNVIEVIGRHLVRAFGEMVCTVKDADKEIEKIMNKINNNG